MNRLCELNRDRGVSEPPVLRRRREKTFVRCRNRLIREMGWVEGVGGERDRESIYTLHKVDLVYPVYYVCKGVI